MVRAVQQPAERLLRGGRIGADVHAKQHRVFRCRGGAGLIEDPLPRPVRRPAQPEQSPVQLDQVRVPPVVRVGVDVNGVAGTQLALEYRRVGVEQRLFLLLGILGLGEVEHRRP